MSEEGVIQEDVTDQAKFGATETMTVAMFSFNNQHYSQDSVFEIDYLMLNDYNAMEKSTATLTIPFSGTYTFMTYSSWDNCYSGSACYCKFQNTANVSDSFKISYSAGSSWAQFTSTRELKKGDRYQLLTRSRIRFNGHAYHPTRFAIHGRK